MEINYDYLFKVIIIGDSGIGKSALLYRFAEDTYNNNYISTIGVDFKIKTLFLNSNIIKLQIWDTAGQERFRTITTSYYRGAHIIFLCYDITDIQSFSNLEMWQKEINRFAKPDVQIILCGTKNDLSSQRQISYEEGKKYAEQFGFDFFETSAKNNKNVNEIFEKSSTNMLEKFQLELKKEKDVKLYKPIQNTISVDILTDKNNYYKKCC